VPETARALLKVRTPSRWFTRYALALAIVGAATLLRAMADPFIHAQVPYFIFVASVVVTTWFCGFDAGVAGSLVAAFVGNYLFVDPRYEFVPHPEDWNAMALFEVVALGLVWLVNRWRTAEQALRKYADDLAALNAEAERINRLKDEFLATLSHELRTPLNAVLGWAQMLENGQLNGLQQQRASESIVRNAKAQARLVEDILDVSAIVSGKLALHEATVDLAAVVRSAADVVRPAADAKRIDVRTSFASHSIMVGDADRLRQVAWNLLSNAVKFTDKGGIVEARVAHEDSQLVLTVSDTGRGIEPSFLPYLFERFRQADSSPTRERGGLGLGLAIVRHMVELHGGTVTAASAGPNCGSTFKVTLPVRAVASEASERVRAAEPVGAAGQSVRATVSLAGLRVLVVDDEPDARDLVNVILSECGAEVRVAASAHEGYREIRAWRPDVIVADIGMPGEDGCSLLRRVRALTPAEGGAIPAAALTAYAQVEDRNRALAAGFQEHVPKPVLARELAEVVAGLARKQPARIH
jgi:signal transduction histidine kinase/ActR/RegA family two-component response regulator